MAAAAYATTAQVNTALGLVDATHDATVDEIILAVSQWFDTAIGVSLTQRSVTEYHDGGPTLHNGIPLEHVPSEDSDDRAALTVVESTVALTIDDDFKLDGEPARVLYRTTGTADDFEGARWAVGERNIKVVYLTAFKVIPKDIERACRDESVRAFKAWYIVNNAGRIGMDSRDGGAAGSQSFTVDDFSEGTQRLMNAYRQRMQVF